MYKTLKSPHDVPWWHRREVKMLSYSAAVSTMEVGIQEKTQAALTSGTVPVFLQKEVMWTSVWMDMRNKVYCPPNGVRAPDSAVCSKLL
jgi:hypothetical protein